MKTNHITLIALLILTFAVTAAAQIPIATHIDILRAEDSLKYDAKLERLFDSPNAKIRERAALAAGRIGNTDAVPRLAGLLANDASNEVRAMAAFALGEIESIDGAEAILRLVSVALPADRDKASAVVARSVEAAGKIAAANLNTEGSRELGRAIASTMQTELARGNERDRSIVRLGLTALIRAIPLEAERIAAAFLDDNDPQIRADAGNTLARIRSGVANERLRQMLANDENAEARANAARALAGANNTSAGPILLRSALNDTDSRVRVAAIRALASIKHTPATGDLIRRTVDIHQSVKRTAKPNYMSHDTSELLELVATIGRLAQGAKHEEAYLSLKQIAETLNYRSPEVEISLARIDPQRYIDEASTNMPRLIDHLAASAYGQGFSEIGMLKNEGLNAAAGKKLVEFFQEMLSKTPASFQTDMLKAIPPLSRSLAALKPDNLQDILLGNLKIDDVQTRATAASLLGDLPSDRAISISLLDAFQKSLFTDRNDNDAQIAIMNALFKQNKLTALTAIDLALDSPDHLVRRRATELLKDNDAWKDVPGQSLERSKAKAAAANTRTVSQYLPRSRTRLGQVLNTSIDYRRALMRKNGSTKAIVTTAKGKFTIDLFPENAPLTVDNFIKLARRGYFNGLTVHRVVPNFVMQDGDPRGDGSGGPGWSIRCEMNEVPFDRGAVGMALSGKDTGGSQWFVTHSAQPHLDGGYTVFGRVNETDMKVVDNIARGDKIINIMITGR